MVQFLCSVRGTTFAIGTVLLYRLLIHPFAVRTGLLYRLLIHPFAKGTVLLYRWKTRYSKNRHYFYYVGKHYTASPVHFAHICPL